MEAVRKGEVWGTLYFTENFTDALVARMALGKDSDDETLDQSEIRVWLDMSSKQEVPFDSSVNLILLYIIFSAYIILYTYYYNSHILFICHFLFSYSTRIKSFTWHLLISSVEMSHLRINVYYLSLFYSWSFFIHDAIDETMRNQSLFYFPFRTRVEVFATERCYFYLSPHRCAND